MQLWADIYDANDVLIAGPIAIGKAKITRVLDGAGSFSFSIPAMVDQVEMLTFERRVILYAQQSNGTRREIGRGIVRKLRSDPGDRMLDVSGPDILGELKQYSVLLGRIYDQETLSNELSDLLSLADGWGLRAKDGATPSPLVDDRFDGVNVLKAIGIRLSSIGQHFRLAAYAKVLEYGTFGDDSGLTLFGGQRDTTHEIIFNDDVAIVEDLTVDGTSEDLCNRIIPVSGGEGEAALNLAHSTRTTPYTILSTAVGAKTVRYLQDDESIDAHGIHEKVLSFDIAPIANNSAAVEVADNALYDAAAEELRRRKDPLYAFDVGGVKLSKPLRPGQKVRLVYKGLVNTRSGDKMFIDVDGDMWVMKVSESFSSSGLSFDMELSSIDRVRMDATEIIVGAIEKAELRGLKPRTGPAGFPLFGFDFIRSPVVGNPEYQKDAIYELNLADYFTDAVKVALNVRTAPLFATAQPAVGATDSFNWTVTVDDTYPSNINLMINGVDVTSDFGGPWNAHPTNAEFNMDFDITDYILDGPVDSLWQRHVIKLFLTAPGSNPRTINFPEGGRPAATALVSHGVVYFTVNVLGTIQAILLA